MVLPPFWVIKYHSKYHTNLSDRHRYLGNFSFSRNEINVVNTSYKNILPKSRIRTLKSLKLSLLNNELKSKL